MTLSAIHQKFLQGRGLDPETAALHGGIFSGRSDADAVIPDPNGDILVFPYHEGTKIVNAKYRGRGKRFWQMAGGKKTFCNVDVLDDPALEIGTEPLIITEGEMDMLSFMQIGYPCVVSVPDGAPPARDHAGNIIPVPEDADDIVPEEDEKFAYILNNWEQLKRVKRIVLATDGDEAGWRLCQELARRLGRSRCSYVTYPDVEIVLEDGSKRRVKDANEVLFHLGDDALTHLIAKAKPFPVRGLYRLSDFPDQGPIRTYSTGIPAFDPIDVMNPKRSRNPHFQLYKPSFMVVSGLPGGGKSTLATQIAFNMARWHGWRVAIASFEMPVKPIIQGLLRGHYIRRPRPDKPYQNRPERDWTRAEKDEADAFIEHQFSFISLMPDDDESEADVDWVIDRAHDAVLRFGIDMLIIDPWNEVEHKRRAGESIADYTNRAIRVLKRFTYSRNVCTMVVAHPTKAAHYAAKQGDPISLHDISDGSAWANKAEIGLIVSRLGVETSQSEIGIRKIKFPGTGRIGDVGMRYDEELEAFV